MRKKGQFGTVWGSSDQPVANRQFLRPSKEVAEKMHPLKRDSFHDLLRRAANPSETRSQTLFKNEVKIKFP